MAGRFITFGGVHSNGLSIKNVGCKAALENTSMMLSIYNFHNR